MKGGPWIYTQFFEYTVHQPKLPDSQLRSPDNVYVAISDNCYLRQVQPSKLMRQTPFRAIESAR